MTDCPLPEELITGLTTHGMPIFFTPALNSSNITRIDGTLSILSGSGSPRTGDNNNLALWIGLLAASAVLIAAVVFTLLRKKKTARKPSASSKAETNAKTRKPRQ